ncbi:MAG: LLM class flavin-dependent oxidoreductase [Immundisolibacterales bacterium]|nr:LLM class flavin-dependent oxidoreductase [Immundisolibacterales bacterium]
MSRIGIAFSGGLTASEIADCAERAEALGYESVWVAEGHGGDQFAILAACALRTRRIRLGTAISSVFVRTAPTIAMAAATVDELSGGRFVLGLGSSHRVQVGPEHGVEYARPLDRVRETVAVVRALLRDGDVSHAGETVRVERFELWFRPHRGDVPVYLSALFPKMLELCGEIADGVILTRSTLASAAAARARVAAGAARAGRDPVAIEIASLFPASVAPDRDEALAAARPGLAFYAGFFPRYNRLLAESGFPAEAAAIAKAWSEGDTAAATRAVTDEMLAATGIAGTPAECRERVEAYRDSGLDLPIISPFARGAGAKERFLAAIEACAP